MFQAFSTICWAVLCVLSCVGLFATPWTVTHRAPLSMELSRQEYWSGLLFPTPGDLPDSGSKPASLMSPVFAGGFLTTVPPRSPLNYLLIDYCLFIQLQLLRPSL